MTPPWDRIRAVVRRITPARLRPLLRDYAVRLWVPSAARSPRPEGSCVTLVGPFRSPTGIGEGARLQAEAFADLGLSVGRLDVTALLRLPADLALPTRAGGCIEGDAGGPLIVHLNPPHFQLALLLRGLCGRNRRLIAFWAWEMERVPAAWRKAFRLAHEIWVPSRFVATALASSGCRTPIRVVPPPVRMPPLRADAPRPAGSPTLRVLTVFAYDSTMERKNPLAALEAFRRAFGDRPDVELVVKTRGRAAADVAAREFAAEAARMNNVRIIERAFQPDEYRCLVDSADVILSLHRAEGFGLPLAEAMASGKPVVATAWSGNLDFMTDATACLVAAKPIALSASSSAYRGLRGAWAEPSVEAASDWLRRLLDPALRRRIGDAAREHVERRLGLAAFRAAIADSEQLPPLPSLLRAMSGDATDPPAPTPAQGFGAGERRPHVGSAHAQLMEYRR